MKRFLFGAVLALSLPILPACATLDEHSASVKLAVTYATMKYIDEAGPGKTVTRAARVAAVANEALNAIEGDGFELASFKAHILQKLPADLSTADRVLALALIDVLSQELQNRIGQGVLTPDTRIKVRQVLGWINEATAFYESA